MEIEEFNVGVPWGHIAVKTWGNKADKPVIVTHGRMDNIGSFDRLIPLLPPSFYYICIDLPSHGKSSRFPPFLPLYFMNFILAFKLILDYFKREKYILLGHSFGAMIGTYFLLLYPEYVEKIIGIDSVIAYTPSRLFKEHLRRRIDSCIQLHEKQNTAIKSTYTEEEAVQKIAKGRWGQPIPTATAKSLTHRILEPAGDDRYYLVVDHRMSFPMYPLHDTNHLKEILQQNPLVCPYLLIMCEKSRTKNFSMKIIEEYKKYKNFKLIWVDSGHDVHISNPEWIAPFIWDFLLKTTAKL